MWSNNTGGSDIEGAPSISEPQIEAFMTLNGHTNINPNIYIFLK